MELGSSRKALVRRDQLENDAEVIRLANDVLSSLGMGTIVCSINDITASLFVRCLGLIINDNLPDVIGCTEEYKMKVVLKTLTKLLQTSLSHITPHSIVAGDRLALRNLLEVFKELIEVERGREAEVVSGLLEQINGLLKQLGININVRNPTDISSTLLVMMMETICSHSITDVIARPRSSQDEEHNIARIIATMEDMLKNRLAHIKPRDIVDKNLMAISNLLEVLSGLAEGVQSYTSDSKQAEEILVNLTNDLISRLHIDAKIRTIQDIDDFVFVTLFEALCADTLKDVIRRPNSTEDRIHNVQVVIDSLAMDVLNTSLSHITGQEIIARNPVAISNLLEVFAEIMDYFLESIASSEGCEEIGQDSFYEDQDLVAPEVIDSILDSHLQRKSDQTFREKSLDIDTGHSSSSTKTADLIALGNVSDVLSHESSQSGSRRERPVVQTGPIGSYSLPEPLNLTSKERAWWRENAPRDRSPTDESDPRDGLIADVLNPRTSFKLPTYETVTRDSSALPSSSAQPLATHARLSNPDNSNINETMTLEDLILSRNSSTCQQYKSNISRNKSPDLSRSRNKSPDLSRSRNKSPDLSRSRNKSPDLLRYRDLASDTATDTSVMTADKSDSSLPKSKSFSPKSKSSPPKSKSFSPKSISSPPKTYEDYLLKYYGKGLHSKDDLSLDSCRPSRLEQEIENCRRNLSRKSKAVRFNDYLDAAATGPVANMRKNFRKEDQKSRMKKEILNKVYQDELEERERLVDINRELSQKTSKEEEYRKVFKSPNTSRYKTKKDTAQSSVLLPRTNARQSTIARMPKRCASASPTLGHKANPTDEDIMPYLLDEFPYLHLEQNTLNHLWRKGQKQVESLSKAEKDVQRKKSKAQEQIEEAEQRQGMLLDIMRKELNHRQRLKEAKERQNHQLSIKAKIRDKRLQSARIRKYYDDFQVRQRARMLKKRTKEEMVFKRIFNEGLNIQKERLREAKKYVKEQREERSKRQQQELESLENYYRDQFSMLTELMEKERKDTTIRDNAQSKALEKMKRDLRKKMEREITDFQQRLWQDDDDIYYRQLDADRIRQELSVAQFQAKM